jgi:histone H3/H4
MAAFGESRQKTASERHLRPGPGVKEPSFQDSTSGEMKMAKAKGKKSGGSAKPTEMLLVSSKVRALIKDAGCNTAGDALDGLNAYVAALVQTAARRASENGRKTVRAHDFHI